MISGDRGWYELAVMQSGISIDKPETRYKAPARSHVHNGRGSPFPTGNGCSRTCQYTILGKYPTMSGKSTTRKEIHGNFVATNFAPT
jgi:hypothetical protein